MATEKDKAIIERETAVALRPGEEENRQEPGADLEIRNWHNEAIKLKEYAEARAIATPDDYKIATDDLAIISKLKKAMNDRRKEEKKPHKDAMDEIEAAYKFWMNPVLEADRITRDKMTAFTRGQSRIRQGQEEINRKRMEAAEAEMRLNGELSESVNLVEVVEEAPKSVSTDMGTAGQRANWKWEVIDFTLLPDEYKIPDGSLLTAIARKHHDQKPIPGIRFYSELGISVRPR